jgi:hypothetical protein
MTRISSVLGSAVLILSCTFASAQIREKASDKLGAEVVSPAVATTYKFTEVNYPGDTFTQLLGINKAGVIAGYHGSALTPQNPNKGFTVTLPNHFTSQNFPGSAQTQVIGINNSNSTSGFYVDSAMNTHGFYQIGGVFKTVDFPGTTFNQVLGWNNENQGAGYSQDSAGNFHPYVADKTAVFESLVAPGIPSAQATSANDIGTVVGFYIDSNQVNHGFVLMGGTILNLNYPGATFTQAFGVNNLNEVVGTYIDTSANQHGFVWKAGAFQSIDDPNGIGTTVTNGINDAGTVVGFWGNVGAGISHGFVAMPQ